jgi:Short C-terminal domain
MGRRAEQQNQAEDEQDQRLSQLEQQQAPPQPSQPAPAAPETSPMIDELNKLATLHQQGVLTDAEFAAAKAKLLGT